MVELTESAVDRAKQDVGALRNSLYTIAQAMSQQSRSVRVLAESKRLHPEAGWSADESQSVAARIDDLGNSLGELYSLLDNLGTALVFEDLTECRRLEEARQAEEREKQRIHSVFQRYMAPAVVERILSDPSQVTLGGQRQKVTALFAEMRGFSPLGASVPPERLVELLNAYLSMAAEAILAEEGTLDKYQGDAVMAVFSAPLAQPDHPLRAARAALAMQRAIARHRAERDDPDELYCGIGINTGEGVVGNIGAVKMMNYTVIGDAVNVAKRLQEMAAPDQILLSQTLHDQLREHVIARPVPEMTLKGHDEPEVVYELLGLAGEHLPV